ncbi:hypothetical protein QTH91_17110 [Variovorax dokdonensis]|uniref:Uncharacterized protein n=1 Tax=Variovorax dokdonensis TaxID=344883 RepID=A0ABT7NE32_9BURK|nr:hypothetical protein [Variovorax dokdonensis]MDM0046214.1 hypothetical protein [Variovorax dokdonensis]
MKVWDRHAKMDEMETLELGGHEFLCSAEQLPSGDFHAVVRYRASPSDDIRTLILDQQRLGSSAAALELAKDLARTWAREHGQLAQ